MKTIHIELLKHKSIIVLLALLSQIIFGQETKQATSPFSSPNKETMFKPILSIESWATYSANEEVKGVEYKNRSDISFRRFRFGSSGVPYSWLKYCFQFHLDRLGEDSYASTKGKYGSVGVDIWNAYITAKLLKLSELLNLEVGYFWAAISRETNTSPWAVGSFDKTRADYYMRNFMTGKGNGIENGVALGGVKNFGKFGINYRIGSYEPDAYASPVYASRLYTGRIMFTIGDPEQKTYKYTLSGNQWKKRNGTTIGFGAASQSNGFVNDSTTFNSSTAYGGDILINYGGLRIDGQYFLMNRQADNFKDFDGTQWHIRAGYSFIIGNKYIEPTICYDSYDGEGSKVLYSKTGDDKTLDVGINWYLNKDKLKLALHYLIQEGSVAGNIGDYIGLCCQVRL